MSGSNKQCTVGEANRMILSSENRVMHNVRHEIKQSENRAVKEAVQWSKQHINDLRNDMDGHFNAIDGRIDNLGGQINTLGGHITTLDKRLTAANSSITNLGTRITEIQRELGAEIDTLAERTNQALVQLDARHTQALNALSNSIYDTLEEQGDWMANEIDRIDNNVNVLSSSMKILGDSLMQLSDNVNTRFNEHQGKIDSLDQEIRALKTADNASQNEKLLQAGRALAKWEDLYKNHSDLLRFASIENIHRANGLVEILNKLKDDPHGCTVSDANNLLNEVNVLKKEAERRRAEWLPIHTATLQLAKSLLIKMEIHREHDIPSLYDENEIETLKANYWTHGRYDALLQQVDKLLKVVETTTDINRLHEIFNQLSSLKQDAENLIIEAAELGVKSEERLLITNEILNVLVPQGWELVGDPDFIGGKDASDYREGTFAILRRKATGEELSVLVRPVIENGKMKSKLSFHRIDNLPDGPVVFRNRMAEITREIEKSGLKIGALKEPACGGDSKLPIVQDANQMRSVGAAERISKALG